MCTVAQCDDALNDFVDDDTLKQLYSIPFQWYKHKPSAPHTCSFKLSHFNMASR